MKFVVLPAKAAYSRILIRKVLILSITLMLPAAVHAQYASDKSALSNLTKQKWERAFQQLKETLHKDSISPATHYVLARYFFSPANPHYQVDSAHWYAQRSMMSYQASTARQRDRLKRFPLDSMLLVTLRQQIDSVAFVQAKATNSEQSYADFINRFSQARELPEATALRDEAAFANALQQDIYPAYRQYLDNYPQGKYESRARALYEERLYRDKTSDGQLDSYRKFLVEYPQSPFRETASQEILVLSTADGAMQSFKDFIDDYPATKAAMLARKILYHLLSYEKNFRELPAALQSDSLQTVIEAEQTYLVPFLHKNRFGFMNAQGQEVMSGLDFEELDETYRCGNIREDILALPGSIIGKNGALLYHGNVTSVDDIGSGFIILQNEQCTKIIHKSGFTPGNPCVQNAKILGGRLLAIQQDSLWSVRTFTGRTLQPVGWDDISITGDIIVFRKDSKHWLSTVAALAATADHSALKLKDAFDEIKVWPSQRVWARAGGYEGVFDQSLADYIPFQEQHITATFFGGVSRSFNRWQLFNNSGPSSQAYDTIIVNEPWVAAKTQQRWNLIQAAERTRPLRQYDSIYFAGTLAIGVLRDSLFIHAAGNVIARLQRPALIEFVAGQDSSAFMMITQRGKKYLYNHQGQRLFQVNFEYVQHGGKNIFVVSKKDKKGLINSEGKLLLPTEFDAISTMQEGKVSVLKGRRFGLYDVTRKKIIKPVYIKNIWSYTSGVLVALKSTGYGFVDSNDKPLSSFEFSDVQVWSDTIALVRKGMYWMFYNIMSRTIVTDRIQDVKMIRDKADDRLAIIRKDSRYGVISSSHGVVLPVNYSDLINVGSPEEPLYFTEKHVEEASLFVVIYYTHDGKVVRKEVYEQDDYERIYCSRK